MQNTTKYVGLDVSKELIAVAVADEGGDPRFLGNIRNTPEAVRKTLTKIGESACLEVCYEAGPTGYGLYRQLKQLGISCLVAAPSLIPRRPGDRVKTDRRDALRLAQLLRAKELTAVWVPTEDDEALRDLVRARQDAKEDLLAARHRLSKFLLRNNIMPPMGVRSWSTKHRQWLGSLKWDRRAQQITFQEYWHAIDEIEERIKRLESEIHAQATDSGHAPVIQALQTLRGVAEVTAVSLVAEVGQFSRFRSPKQLMAYAGLVPREYSTGGSRWQGGITKTGNTHLRFAITESAWSYRYKPALKGEIRKRQEGKSPQAQSVAWKAQDRLHRKYSKMLSRGKNSGVAITAVARELLGFVWAIACEVEHRAKESEQTSA